MLTLLDAYKIHENSPFLESGPILKSGSNSKPGLYTALKDPANYSGDLALITY